MAPEGGPKARIFEVFTSIEGEGIFCGTKTLFVRMAGCPFKCFWCDTEQALPPGSGTEYGMDEARGLIDGRLEKNTFKVNFTGGEPLVQHEAVAALAEHVRSRGVRTYLESSCYDSGRFAFVLPHIDLVKVEFKTADSEFVGSQKHGGYVLEAAKCLRLALEAGRQAYVKVVVSSRTARSEFAALADRIFEAGRVPGFAIQPAHGEAAPPLELLMEFYDLVAPRCPGVRVIPQLHKALGAP